MCDGLVVTLGWNFFFFNLYVQWLVHIVYETNKVDRQTGRYCTNFTKKQRALTTNTSIGRQSSANVMKTFSHCHCMRKLTNRGQRHLQILTNYNILNIESNENDYHHYNIPFLGFPSRRTSDSISCTKKHCMNDESTQSRLLQKL